MKSRHLLIASAVAVTAKWAKQNPNTMKAFISLPTFPLGVDAVRLQRVASAMKRFGLLPKSTSFQVTTMITR